MIGSTFKKFAEENGMKVSNGVAYGNLRGYAATLSEGSGWKMIVLSTKFPEFAGKDAMQAELNGLNLQKEYRVNQLNFMDDGIVINFLDNPGTMGKIKEFIDFFFPLLEQHGATGADICTECGMELVDAGKWVLVNGVAMHVHEGCAQSIRHQGELEDAQRKENDNGTYGKGFLGAFLGALVGAIPWAVVQYFGYIASILGLLIGWLAKKGYELLHGKNGKGKLAIILICSILGVIIGNLGADVISLISGINDGTLEGLTYGDIPAFMAYLFATNTDYLIETIKNVLLGLLFAALGMIDVFRGTRQETKSFSMIELE